jgi:hypothetical protein
MNETNPHTHTGDLPTESSDTRLPLNKSRRRQPGVIAPSPEKTARLLAWIDEARAVNWPMERNLLIFFGLLGLIALLAIRLGLISS